MPLRATFLMMMCAIWLFGSFFVASPVFAASAPVLGVVKSLDATDFFWYVDPSSKQRFFVASSQDLQTAIAWTGKIVSADEVAQLPLLLSDQASGADMDGDGLSDELEVVLGSDFTRPDTDGDGHADGDEVRYGYLPTNPSAAARYAGLRPDKLAPLRFSFVRSGADAPWWYVSGDGRRIFIGGSDGFQALMRRSSRVTDEALKRVPVSLQSPIWLTVPAGYHAELAATGFTFPRVLAFDSMGHLVVADMSDKGKVVALLDNNKDGITDDRRVIIDGLKFPHGIAFGNDKIYVARERAVEAWDYDPVLQETIGKPKKLMDLPASDKAFPGGGHRTRTLVIDGAWLYVSIGSNCNACIGYDKEFAVIKRINLGSGKIETFASGLRNTVFFMRDSRTGMWWGNDMGQDDLGDDVPPDEINYLTTGAHYGWPYCYGDRKSTPLNKKPELCKTTIGNVHSYQAHSAPLGIAAIPNSFSSEWSQDFLSSLHGSTVRSARVGYKVVRVMMGQDGQGSQQFDFITGFLRGKNAIVGRPVALTFDQAGALYLSDDFANVIYRITRD